MLVCSVSLRPPRRAIAATIAEAVAASDATATGNIVFATLVDDPASVRDIVDAYSGEIMLEAATAAATVNAGLIYIAAVVEEMTAAATQTGTVPTTYVGAITEAASADDSPSATIGVVIEVTVTSPAIVGPLFSMDTTFAVPAVTVIDATRVD